MTDIAKELRDAALAASEEIDRLQYQAVLDRRAKAWQRIETAPRDGTEFLVTRDNWADSGNVNVGYWHRDRMIGAGGGTLVTDIWKYWQPLPAGPVTS